MTNWGIGGLTQSATFGAATGDSGGTRVNSPITGLGKGPWTQITADSGSAAHAVKVCMTHLDPCRILCDIGIGAAASEEVIIPNLYWESVGQRGISLYYYVPVYIPANSRIAARVENDEAANDDAIDVVVITLGAPWMQPEMMHRVIDYGTIPGAATKLTSVDAGGTIHTKGAWSQLVASTISTIRWLIVVLGGNANGGLADVEFLHDIGVGSAGNEEIISADMYTHSGNGVDDHLSKIYHFPCYIPDGSRIAIRSQSQTIDSNDRLTYFAVYGIG